MAWPTHWFGSGEPYVSLYHGVRVNRPPSLSNASHDQKHRRTSTNKESNKANGEQNDPK
jgi:hypothetical protein